MQRVTSAALSVCAVLLASLFAWGEQAETPMETLVKRAILKGLPGVSVLVYGLGPEAERDGLIRVQLQREVELRLRTAGIRVLTEQEARQVAGYPSLVVSLITLRTHDPVLENVYAIGLNVQLLENVRLSRDTAIEITTPTWNSKSLIGLMGVSKLAQRVRAEVAGFVDGFISDYLAANPK
jgi:hypothetical protein